MKKLNFLRLAREAARIAADKKATDVVILNVRRLTALADYFVIVTAHSAPQMKAVTDAIGRSFRDEEGLKPAHREGMTSSSWTVLDYGGLVVHVMSPETRSLYALERIWADARKVT